MAPPVRDLVRILIVDGYNVIRQTPPYSHLAEHDLDSARAALISDVAAFAQGEYVATVVFDGHNNPLSKGLAHQIAGVTVVFSRYGIEADSVIELLARAARERGDTAVVVTSDAQMQWAVMGGGVGRMSSAEFSGELRDGGAEWREHAPAGSSRGRIEERIDPVTASTLARWARGLE